VTGLVLLTAVGTGVGLWLIVVGLWPRPPRLDKALAALDPPPEPGVPQFVVTRELEFVG